MEFVANPILLYLCIALGGFGVALTLPRPKLSPQIIGALLAAAGLGGAFLALALKAGAERPGLYFYVFAAIALGSALRVISHPKPVYAALYFILTILASSALYLMLGAEFMAFALIIIYAGAILITYLFVIMLAEQTPAGQEVGVASEYDRYSREPGAAVIVGFVLLGLLTAMLSRGAQTLEPAAPRAQGEALLAKMPKKIIEAYDRLGALEPRGGFARPEVSAVGSSLNTQARTMTLAIADVEKFKTSLNDPRLAALFGADLAADLKSTAQSGQVITLALPPDLRTENLDGVGFTLIAEHPMALELAGVILLMAMLGAVVLARKQIEIGEEEKAAAAKQ